MSRMVGTVSRGIRAPIIREGDNLAAIVTQSVLDAAKDDGFSFHDRDVIAMTEAIVARAQGNYATTQQIAKDVREKTGGGTVCTVEDGKSLSGNMNADIVTGSQTLLEKIFAGTGGRG